jgi:hypothetical protein
MRPRSPDNGVSPTARIWVATQTPAARPWSTAHEFIVPRRHINQPGLADRIVVSAITGSDS